MRYISTNVWITYLFNITAFSHNDGFVVIDMHIPHGLYWYYSGNGCFQATSPILRNLIILQFNYTCNNQGYLDLAIRVPHVKCDVLVQSGRCAWVNTTVGTDAVPCGGTLFYIIYMVYLDHIFFQQWRQKHSTNNPLERICVVYVFFHSKTNSED